MKAASRDSRRCIFCGAPKVTREDVWPQWLQRLNLRTGSEHGHWTSAIDKATGKTSVNLRTAPGPNMRVTLKRVCRACNSGWMSRIQTAAAKLMVPMIAGEWASLDERAQLTLAQWATMFCMVHEFKDPETVTVPQEQRTAFGDGQKPPGLFRVWVGRYAPGGSNHGGTYHRPISANGSSAFQSTVIALDNLLFYVISADQDRVLTLPSRVTHKFTNLPEPSFAKGAIRQIWPHVSSIVEEPLRMLSDADFEALAAAIGIFVNVPGRQMKIIGPTVGNASSLTKHPYMDELASILHKKRD